MYMICQNKYMWGLGYIDMLCGNEYTRGFRVLVEYHYTVP